MEICTRTWLRRIMRYSGNIISCALTWVGVFFFFFNNRYFMVGSLGWVLQLRWNSSEYFPRIYFTIILRNELLEGCYFEMIIFMLDYFLIGSESFHESISSMDCTTLRNTSLEFLKLELIKFLKALHYPYLDLFQIRELFKSLAIWFVNISWISVHKFKIFATNWEISHVGGISRFSI